MLRTNGLSRKKGYKEGNLLTHCGYSVILTYCGIFARFYPFTCIMENHTSQNYNDCGDIMWLWCLCLVSCSFLQYENETIAHMFRASS